MKGQEYDEECDTDTVLEWECPNGCKFNNEEIDVIDEEVNMAVSKCVCG